MPRQIEVLVEDISKDEQGHPTELTGTTRILTYKSFNYLNANPENPRYKLLYEVDEKGKEVPGSPNLNAQHRKPLQQRSAEPVVNAGQNTGSDSVNQRQKPGPKSKKLNSVTEITA